MTRFGPENSIHSIGKIDERWQEERRRDLEFTHALLDLAEKFPYLIKSLQYILTGKEINKDLPSQSSTLMSSTPRLRPEGQSGQPKIFYK